MGSEETIKRNIEGSLDLMTGILDNKKLIDEIGVVADVIIQCFNNGGKLLLCGNGGSATDAGHLAAEFSGKYYFDRPPLHAEALHVNAAFLTAVANDYAYEVVYARLLTAVGKRGDVLIGLSTSGNSINVIRALEKAKELEMITVSFSGEGGGKMKKYSDYLIEIPSTDTPRIQECHMLIGHTICEIVENTLFSK